MLSFRHVAAAALHNATQQFQMVKTFLGAIFSSVVCQNFLQWSCWSFLFLRGTGGSSTSSRTTWTRLSLQNLSLSSNFRSWVLNWNWNASFPSGRQRIRGSDKICNKKQQRESPKTTFNFSADLTLREALSMSMVFILYPHVSFQYFSKIIWRWIIDKW